MRKLRANAGGMPYRLLAQRAGYSATTLSQAAAGERLPTLPVTLAYVRACGGDVVEWEARWKQAVEEVAASSTVRQDAGAEPPYKGLARFETGDSARFFGRDRLTADLLDLLRRRRFAAVFGPSGSGKSSLLRAGLIPTLQHTQDTALRPASIRILAPGEHPAHTHSPAFTAGGAPSSAAATGADTLVVVDQFEELFTLCHDPAERARFIDLLLDALRPESGLRVLIAVRADFYGHCAEHRDLAGALRDAHLLVGPMSPEEVREAVVKPATATGLTVERALTARLVEEVTDAPGGLPLLSHALLETWRRRRGKTLTVTGYEAAGGLAGAIAKTAEEVYGRFTEDQAAAARRLLLRLVVPGDGTPDTRRPVGRAELEDIGGHETAQVLEALTRARLLTADDDTVDLAHEALLTTWPRLHRWIDQDREHLRVQRTLSEAARTWKDLGHDPGALYRGTRLTTAREHFGSRPTADLTSLEHAFLTSSLEAREQEERATARSTRRLHRLRAGLSALAVLALIAGLVAWQESRFGDQRLADATSRRVAAAAEAMRYADPLTAMRLSVAAWRISPTLEAKAALVGPMTQREQDVFNGPGVGATSGRFLSSDSRTLVTSDHGQVSMWDVDSRRRTHMLRIRPDTSAYDLSPDGKHLLVVAGDTMQLRDVSSGQTVSLPFKLGDAYAVFAADGQSLKVVAKHSVIMWDVRRRRATFRRGSRTPVRSPLDATGRFMALCTAPTVLEVWDTRTSRLIRAWRSDTVSQEACSGDRTSVVLDPGRRTLMVVTGTGLRTWNWDSGKELPTAHEVGSDQSVWDYDGRFLVTADDDTMRMWRAADLSTPVYQYPLHHHDIREVHLDTERRVIRYLEEQSASAAVVRTLYLGDALTRRWHDAPAKVALPQPEQIGGRLTAVAPGPPGSDRVATGDDAGWVTVWDGAQKRRLSTFSGTTSAGGSKEPGSVTALTYSPDGQFLAVGGSSGTVRLWDAVTSRPLGSTLLTAGDSVQSLTFARDGTTLTVDSEHTPPHTYGIAPESIVESICRRSRGGMRTADWQSLIPELPYRQTC